MSKYASDTKVSAEKSRMEIEKVLARYGATQFFYASEVGKAIVGFTAHDRIVKMVLPLPDLSEFEYPPLRRGQYYKTKRTKEQQLSAFNQAVRTKWRCLLLAIKAKLEIVESGIATFEQEFLSHIMIYDGRTVGEAIRPQLEQSYSSGKNIPLMLGAGE